MKLVTVLRCVFAASVLLAGAWAAQRHTADEDGSACAMVQRALADSQMIKAGMTRGEVETYFAYDGGLQFPDNARFAYPRCTFLKLEVRFRLADSRGSDLTSSGDTVVSVSRLYVEYPMKD